MIRILLGRTYGESNRREKYAEREPWYPHALTDPQSVMVIDPDRTHVDGLRVKRPRCEQCGGVRGSGGFRLSASWSGAALNSGRAGPVAAVIGSVSHKRHW